MVVMVVEPIIPVPQSDEGFYAINNPFLVSGPKGFVEHTFLDNGDLFIRYDLPGVPKYHVEANLDESKKHVHIFATAPEYRKYETRIILKPGDCNCYELSGLTSDMSDDGVLGLTLKKDPTTTHRPPGCACEEEELLSSDARDPKLTGMTLMPHPFITHGPAMAYEFKKLQDGGLYVRVDMPGVPDDNFIVSVSNGRVKVTGEAPAKEHDLSGRSYSGDVAMVTTPVKLMGFMVATGIPVDRIKRIANNGVIRLTIPSLY